MYAELIALGDLTVAPTFTNYNNIHAYVNDSTEWTVYQAALKLKDAQGSSYPTLNNAINSLQADIIATGSANSSSLFSLAGVNALNHLVASNSAALSDAGAGSANITKMEELITAFKAAIKGLYGAAALSLTNVNICNKTLYDLTVLASASYTPSNFPVIVANAKDVFSWAKAISASGSGGTANS